MDSEKKMKKKGKQYDREKERDEGARKGDMKCSKKI